MIAVLEIHAIKEQPDLISAAISVGVRHWYPSEFGAHLTVREYWNERYYQDKVLTREYLKKRASEAPGFGFTYFLDGRLSE
jgi:hypothetical protein